MLTELFQRLRSTSGAPYEKFVVVSSRRQLLFIEGPLEPAYFLSVPDEFGKVIIAAPQVSVQNAVVSAARTEECIVPSDRANPSIVAFERLHDLCLCRIPDLKISCMRSYCELIAVSGPLHASYSILRSDVTQLCDFAVRC